MKGKEKTETVQGDYTGNRSNEKHVTVVNHKGKGKRVC